MRVAALNAVRHKKLAIVDRDTGVVPEAEIFVGVLGASNYTYAEASWTQGLADWIGAHVRMFRDFGGVPRLLVPDNLKSGVHKASFYDPELNRSYAMMASHYGVGILPARPRKPRDKAKVEAGVRLAQTYILGRLRRQTFFSLAEANAAVVAVLDRLNRHVKSDSPGGTLPESSPGGTLPESGSSLNADGGAPRRRDPGTEGDGMEFMVIAYTASIFAALLAMNTYAHWGLAEVHTYTIPPYIEERGYTAQIVANQVVDAMRRIQTEVAALEETEVVTQGRVQPAGQLASYFGMVSLLRAAESTLGFGPSVVEIEVTQHEDIAHWRVRGVHAVRGYEVRQGHLPLDAPDALINELGLQVTGYVSPFEALAYRFMQDSAAHQYDDSIATASALLLDCQRRWAWVCTEVNINNVHLLRGMAYLGSEQFGRAFDDFAWVNKSSTPNALGTALYGYALAALGQEEEAQLQYQKAQRLDSDIGKRFYELARGYAQAGNHALADHRYTTASDLGLASEAFLVDWGDSLLALGWHVAALERYRQAEAINAATNHHHLLYADRIDRAMKALDEATTSTSPDEPAKPPVHASKQDD